MAFTLVTSGTLLSVNVGLAAALGFLFPLGAQIDALLALGLGPFQADLALQFNAAIALKATLSLSIGDPLLGLNLALAALAQLQAALQAALSLPPIQLSLGAELGATAALAGALSFKLGGIALLIELALAIKIPALKAAAELQAALGLGPVFLHTFDSVDLATAGAEISAAMSAGFSNGGDVIPDTGTPVFGVVFTTAVPAVQTSMGLIFGF